ncbi:MAG: hypothetical protein J5760_06125, partial [Clostridia bacterium]|nr:hypothetical protein [Clostridia bacterium]
ISADLLGMYGGEGLGHADRISKLIAEKNDLPEGSVFFHMTHTHTGPDVFSGKEPTQYDSFVERRLIDVVSMALLDMKPVTGMYSSNDGIVKNTTFVRRMRYKDGHVMTWGRFGNPDIVDYAEPSDESLRVIKIDREEAPSIILVNFQIHPDTLGGELYCTDYVGMLRETVEKAVPNSICMYFDGAEGDLTNSNYLGVAPNKGYDVRTVDVAKNIADEAIKQLKNAKPLSGEKVKFYNEYFPVPTKRNPAEVPEAKRIMEIYNSGRASELGTQAEINCLVSNAGNIIKLEEQKLDFMQLRVSGVRVGDLAFIGMPCEPFCEIGVKTRAASKFATTCVCCQTNGCVGYIAMEKNYDEGGYEPASSKIKRGGGELLIEGAKRVLAELYK